MLQRQQDRMNKLASTLDEVISNRENIAGKFQTSDQSAEFESSGKEILGEITINIVELDTWKQGV